MNSYSVGLETGIPERWVLYPPWSLKSTWKESGFFKNVNTQKHVDKDHIWGWGNWGREKLSDFPEVQASSRVLPS